MNRNLKFKQSISLKKRAIVLLSRTFARVVLKFGLSRNFLIQSIEEQLVLEAKKQDPDASIVTLSIRTGIDRRYISGYLKGEAPESKPDKIVVILEDIRWTINRFYEDGLLPKYGPVHTLQSIVEKRASGTLTLMAVLEELLRWGNIEEVGDYISVNNYYVKINKKNVNSSNIVGIQLNRDLSTMIYNSTKENVEDRLLYKCVSSSHIDPKYYASLHADLFEVTERYKEESNSLMISFEEDVPVGTYDQYGVTYLEFQGEHE
jgi:hypothetical protein